MNNRAAVVLAVAIWCLVSAAPTRAGFDDATLFRLFLIDGTTLVSYGEFARVGERVVFSMPLGPVNGNPELQLVNISEARIDWDRTNRYSESARAAHYIATQGEADYAQLNNDVAGVLNQVTTTTADADQRVQMVSGARRKLAEWPAAHYNYRSADVQQMLSVLDETIAELRAAGVERFALSLSATSQDAPARGPSLLPPPTAAEAVEQTLAAARAVDSASDRMALLKATIGELDRGGETLAADWVNTRRVEVEAAIRREQQIDRAYRVVKSRVLARANALARRADVIGVQRVIARLGWQNAALRRDRPEEMKVLMEELQGKLDATRRLRLARDGWEVRASDLRQYRVAMSTPLELFAGVRPALRRIESLAGSPASSLFLIQRAVARIVEISSNVAPPDEFRSAHALLVSAAQLAANAARLRREAILSGDLSRAWDASSAAAGALMLEARARSGMSLLLRPPQLK